MLNLFISSILVNNIILTLFLGINPFIDNKENNFKYLIYILSSLLLSTLIIYPVNIILNDIELIYLKPIIYVVLILMVIKIVDLIANKFIKETKLFEYLLVNNTLILGTSLLITDTYNLLESLLYALGSGLGFILVVFLFNTIKERLKKVPACLKGVPIALITASIMALLFVRYL